MKPSYVKVQLHYLSPQIEALQESVAGIVTRYLDAAGNPVDPGFAECVPVAEVPAPLWAPDVPEPVEEVENA
ncbi:hypothetical protein [Aestuariivirga litoralis]|uniref:hypothetical protein n=1 Tax=Aestuariivirga litoralis TaxID=2650924 RepID=UPI0018C4F84F|nr:hypothetical protein [Aestuariivirga litoralis]MBG1232228.1 hypothetical protein [Aestuariivirga litoralis]